MYQKKCHICTVEQEVFGNRVEYEEDKMQEKIKVYLKTRVNCNILRIMNFSKYRLPYLSLYRKEFVSL